MKNIRILRAITDHSQWDLCGKTGIPAYKISLIEGGHVEPNSDEIQALSAAFGVDPEVLSNDITIRDGQVVVT